MQTPIAHSTSIPSLWWLKGHASQRELIKATRSALPQLYQLASHAQHRPEITSLADHALQEPMGKRARLDWVMEQVRVHNISLLHAGQSGRDYEPLRQALAQSGCQLISGALSLADFEAMDDKALFIQRCEHARLAVTPATVVRSRDELQQAMAAAGNKRLCVKPVKGVYAAGFWVLNPEVSPFYAFAQPDNRQVHPEQFVQAYALDPKPYLVMPFLSGQEYSVDLVVLDGKTLAAAIRTKIDSMQHISPWLPEQTHHVTPREQAVVDLAVRAVDEFKCDGLVNVQLREDADGRPHLLEINARPSGGIGYGLACGLNLPAIMVANRLGISLPVNYLQPLWVRVVDLPIPIPAPDRNSPPGTPRAQQPEGVTG